MVALTVEDKIAFKNLSSKSLSQPTAIQRTEVCRFWPAAVAHYLLAVVAVEAAAAAVVAVAVGIQYSVVTGAAGGGAGATGPLALAAEAEEGSADVNDSVEVPRTVSAESAEMG